MRRDGSRRAARHVLALAFALTVGFARSGGAQQHSFPTDVPLPPEAPPRSAVPAQPQTAAYDVQLDRLAELMGTLAFMRDLCGAGDGAVWHDKMAALIESEGKTGLRAERIAGSYNRGFRGYQSTYRTCTPAAEAVIARALDEGTGIARSLALQFGND